MSNISFYVHNPNQQYSTLRDIYDGDEFYIIGYSYSVSGKSCLVDCKPTKVKYEVYTHSSGRNGGCFKSTIDDEVIANGSTAKRFFNLFDVKDKKIAWKRYEELKQKHMDTIFGEINRYHKSLKKLFGDKQEVKRFYHEKIRSLEN